jgi:hypothetical protein
VNFIARRSAEEIMRSTFTIPTILMPATTLAAAKRFAVGPRSIAAASLAHLSYSPIIGGLGIGGPSCGESYPKRWSLPLMNPATASSATASSTAAMPTSRINTERNALNSLIGTVSVERPEPFDFAHPLRM